MCKEERMRQNMAVVVRHLEENGIVYGQATDRPVLFMVISTKVASHFCSLTVTDRLFSFLSTYGCHAAEEKRQAVAELLTRINNEMAVGSLVMDFRDGEIRVRNAMIIGEDEPGIDVVENTIRHGLHLAAHHHPAIMALLWNDLSPEDAFTMARQQ